MTSATRLADLERLHAAPSAETTDAAIARGNRWGLALVEAGFGELVADELHTPFAGEAVTRAAPPATESEVRAAEDALGLELPPSYRAFLLEVGALAFLNYWWDDSTPVVELARQSASVGADVAMVHARSPLVAACAPVQVVRFADHHNHAGEWIYLCNFRDGRGEAPWFLWFHDDAFGDGDDLQWVQRVASAAMAVDTPPPRVVDATAAVTTALTSWVDDILAGEQSQRDQLQTLAALPERATRANDAEIVTILHALRKGIGSKKLRTERDHLVGRLRRDGLAGGDPLPTLTREIAAAAPAPVFATFPAWVSDRVDRMIDEVSHALRKRLLRAL